jgi:type VI secretion system protein ImpA
MGDVNVDDLLNEIQPDQPCGENLEYDAAFIAFLKLAAGKPEQVMGKTTIPGEAPDWREVEKAALALSSRTHDLRVGLLLTESQLHTRYYAGLRTGLTLIEGMLERYWDTLNPPLDPEDDNDPTMRVNIISTLIDPARFLHVLRTVPLVQSPSVGRFSLWDLAVAKGDIPPPKGTEPPKLELIEAAFTSSDLEVLQATALDIDQALERVKGVERTLTDRVGVSNSINLGDLQRVLFEAKQAMAERIAPRQAAIDAANLAAEEEGAAGDAASGGEGGAARPARGISGEVQTRQDVVQMLDKLMAYYSKNEPSSPVPILLGRAKRLATMDFLQIMENISPDAMTQVQVLRGPGEE